MNDVLSPDVSKWQFLEERARGVLEAFAYRELRTPVLEYTPLFVRSVGEVTDVVEKQMYTFDDRDGRSVSLRPEGTASAVRAYIENAQWNKEPVTRWYYLGPMFRHERAQRGRLRQFHQIGAEWFGVNEPSADAETIAMLTTMIEEIGIPAAALEVNLNSLGEPEERAAYRDALVAFYRQHAGVLDEDSQRRLETNPLRILDSKNPEIVALNTGAPVLLETLSPGSQARFHRVRGAAQGRCGSATPWISVWCAGWTTTRRRSSRSRPMPVSLARKTPSAAVGATTGWSRRSAGPRHPRLGSRSGSSEPCWRWPSRARATNPPSACSSRQ